MSDIKVVTIADELLTIKTEDKKKFRLEHSYNIVSKTGNYEELLNNNRFKPKNKAKS